MIACQAHNKWTVQMGDANASAAVFQDEMGVRQTGCYQPVLELVLVSK